MTYEEIVRGLHTQMKSRRIKQLELAKAASLQDSALSRMFNLEWMPDRGRYRQEMTVPDFLAFCKRLELDPCLFFRKDEELGLLPADLARIFANIRERMAAEQALIVERIEQMLRDHDRLKEIAKGEKADEKAEIPFTVHEG